MTGLIFSHGWGLDPSFFDPLKLMLSEHPTLLWDRGYYGDRHCPAPSQDPKGWIGIGHSLGLTHLIQSNLPLKGLIGLNAFGCFLGQNPFLALQRKPILRAFHQNFLKFPHSTVSEFRESCGLKLSPFEPNLTHLGEDLLLLGNNVIDSWPSIPTLIIGCENDPIVPPNLIEDNVKTLSQVTVVILPGGGHGLDQSFARIAFIIEEFIRQL